MSLGALNTLSSSTLYSTRSCPIFSSLPIKFEREYISAPSSPTSPPPTDLPTQVLTQSNSFEEPQEAEPDLALPDEDYQLPVRRKPPIAPGDRFRGINARTHSLQSIDGYQTFITEEMILKKHSMRFIEMDGKKEAVAITQDGYYVVLQQANSSCFPSCVTAMALYLGARPLFKEMQDPATKTCETEQRYFTRAGLRAIEHPLNGEPMEKVIALEILQKKFPGILQISDSSSVGSHMVVLISLSRPQRRITIMDPYHGWMITVKLVSFMNYIAHRFIAIEK